MALFDRDNPGKNVANATLWLEASEDSSDGGMPSGDGGCLPDAGCMVVIAIFVAFTVIPAFLISCVSNLFS